MIEDSFLATLCADKSPVTVFLLNGIKLQGILTSLDSVALLLRREDHVQLVYKHAIATIVPQASVRFDQAPTVSA